MSWTSNHRCTPTAPFGDHRRVAAFQVLLPISITGPRQKPRADNIGMAAPNMLATLRSVDGNPDVSLFYRRQRNLSLDAATRRPRTDRRPASNSIGSPAAGPTSGVNGAFATIRIRRIALPGSRRHGSSRTSAASRDLAMMPASDDLRLRSKAMSTLPRRLRALRASSRSSMARSSADLHVRHHSSRASSASERRLFAPSLLGPGGFWIFRAAHQPVSICQSLRSWPFPTGGS